MSCFCFLSNLYLGVAIHEHLYAWIAVFVLPVNSALNPVLYTLTTAAFKQQVKCNISFPS